MNNKQKAIIKQLIATATPLLIQNAPEAIHYTFTILDLTMLI